MTIIFLILVTAVLRWANIVALNGCVPQKTGSSRTLWGQHYSVHCTLMSCKTLLTCCSYCKFFQFWKLINLGVFFLCRPALVSRAISSNRLPNADFIFSHEETGSLIHQAIAFCSFSPSVDTWRRMKTWQWEDEIMTMREWKHDNLWHLTICRQPTRSSQSAFNHLVDYQMSKFRKWFVKASNMPRPTRRRRQELRLRMRPRLQSMVPRRAWTNTRTRSHR